MKHFWRIMVEGEVYDLAKKLLGHLVATLLAAHLLHGMPAQAVATLVEVPATVEVAR